MARRVTFSEEGAKRIVETVRAHERGNRDQSAIHFRQVGDDSTLRLCKTSSAFNKGTTATLDVWEDGTPPSESQTSGQTVPDVVNKYANIASGKFVSVALHNNGRWYVIAAECS
jgi:hypothetical protein